MSEYDFALRMSATVDVANNQARVYSGDNCRRYLEKRFGSDYALSKWTEFTYFVEWFGIGNRVSDRPEEAKRYDTMRSAIRDKKKYLRYRQRVDVVLLPKRS